MHQFSKNFILCAFLFLSITPIFAQVVKENSKKSKKNALGLYLGLFEYNVNYERYIIRHPKSNTNFRVGFGNWSNLTLGGYNFNLLLVQVFGKKSSHLELNLGAKYVFETAREKNIVLPDIFVGYRYDKAESNFIFRTGISYPSLINVGFGIKL